MTIAKLGQRSTGATMIEVLVALLVFTVGLLGFAALQLSALQSSGDSGQRTQATWITQELAERMRANPEAAANTYAAAANCSNLPAQRCSDYYDPITGQKVNATSCTAAQMAAFDRWEAQCPYSATTAYSANAAAGSGRYNSRDFLSQSSGADPLTISVTGTQLSIITRWLSTAGKDSNANLSNAVQVQR